MERLSNLGYCMIKKEAPKGTAVIPTTGLPLYSETLSTNLNFDSSEEIIGIKAAIHHSYMGQRDYTGQLVMLAEPNTMGLIFDMLLTHTGVTGSGPYTHTYALSPTTNPNSYTVDILRGQVPYRYVGLEASSAALSYDKNKGVLTVGVSARGCFSAAKITNVATNVLTLDTTFGSNPTNGLVTGDNVTLYLSGGTTVNTTISSLTATTVTVTSAGSAAAGDTLCLRALTPALSLLDPVMWARSEYRFGVDAATALTNTHTPIEPGSGGWTITHSFKDNKGEKRSGSFDPASLIRTTGNAEIKTTQFFDSPNSERDFLLMTKNALVARHFVGSNYEVRVTLNDLRAADKPNGIKAGEVIYDKFSWVSNYNDTDGQMFGVSIVNNLPTI